MIFSTFQKNRVFLVHLETTLPMNKRSLVEGRITNFGIFLDVFLSFCVVDDVFRFSKKMCFGVLFVHPTVVLMLLSASFERCFVSLMRYFFFKL